MFLKKEKSGNAKYEKEEAEEMMEALYIRHQGLLQGYIMTKTV
jgi:hypothetical protein